MVGYAVSGFVDGFFKGREFKNAQEDRKLDRERQKRLDAMDEEMHNLRLREFGLREQEFGLRRRSADAEFSEYERGLARRAQEEEFHRRLAETMPLGVPGAAQPGIDPGAFPIGQPQGQPAIVAPVAPARPAAPANPRLGFGAMPATVAPQAAVDLPPEGLPITNIQPVQYMRDQSAPSQAQGGKVVVDAATGLPMAVMPPRAEDLTPGRAVQPRSAARSIADATAPVRGAVADMAGTFARTTDKLIGNVVGAAEGVVGAGSAAVGAGASVLGMPKAGQQFFDYAGQRFNDAKRLASEGYFGVNAGASPQSAQPNAPATIAPARVGDAPPAVKAAESAAATSPAPAASANATKQAVNQVALSFGLKPGEKITERQTQSAADAALEWYNETAVPEMMRYYVSTGQLDKAQAYAEIMESRAGQNAMRLRAAAAFKAVNGDIDGWGRDILESFKSYGYVDPTYDIDEEATGMIRDSAGNFAGARLVFKDRKTGDTVEKLFQSENELFNYGLLMTDPATMVETMMANANKSGQEAGAMNDSQKQIFDSAKIILESSKDGMGVATKTWEQALQEAAAGVAAVTGQVPSGLGTLGASQAIPVDPRISGVGDTGFYRAP